MNKQLLAMITAASLLAGCDARMEEFLKLDNKKVEPTEPADHSAPAPTPAANKQDPAATGGASPYRESLLRIRASDHDRALQVLTAAGVDQTPDGQLLLAVNAAQAGDEATAVKHLNNCLQADPSNATAWALRGDIALRVGRHDLANEALLRADQLIDDQDPLKPDILRNLAVAQFYLGNYADADQSFTRYHDIKGSVGPEDARMAGLLAYVHHDHQRAVNYWQHLNETDRAELAGALADESEAYRTLTTQDTSRED